MQSAANSCFDSAAGSHTCVAQLDCPTLRYNRTMALGTLIIHVMELMFFLGLIGSAVVVLISFFEDGKELFGKD
jgi:hypothetical protein